MPAVAVSSGSSEQRFAEVSQYGDADEFMNDLLS
jgi:hypothetical protein